MITEKKRACIKAYEQGLALYRIRKFREALKKFNEAISYDPDDHPTKVFIDRCTHFIQHPVKDDWDGVFEMKTK